jgi:predicted phage replisome organizer
MESAFLICKGENMAENVQWIRLKVGMFDGNSFKKIKRAKIGGVAFRDKLTAVWFELLDLAGKSNANGYLVDNNEIPYRTFEDIAIMLDREEKEIELCMQFFINEKMVEIVDDIFCLTNFMQYQNQEGLDKIREQKRLRQARWRERKAQGLVGYVDEKASTTPSTDGLLSNSLSNSLSDSKSNISDEVISKYNTICTNLSKVLKKTPKREKAIKSFLKEMTVEEFENACKMANETDFLVGKNEKGWRADFDFIIKQDNAIKILEGKYSKGNSLKPHDNKNEYYFNDIVNI